MAILKVKEGHSAAVARLRADCVELFWDIDVSRLDLQEHYKLIITQVLNYGSLTAVQHLFKVFTEQAMRTALEEPIKGSWYPRTYTAFCTLLDAEPHSRAVNRTLIRPRKKDAMTRFFERL